MVLNAVWIIGGLVWLFSFSENKLVASIAMICTWVVVSFTNVKLPSHYETTGRAVRVRHSRTVFVNGLPIGMVGTRLAVLVIVAIMLALGLMPISIDAAKPSIIICITSLFALMFFDFFLEARAIKMGQAKEVMPPEK